MSVIYSNLRLTRVLYNRGRNGIRQRYDGNFHHFCNGNPRRNLVHTDKEDTFDHSIRQSSPWCTCICHLKDRTWHRSGTCNTFRTLCPIYPTDILFIRDLKITLFTRCLNFYCCRKKLPSIPFFIFKNNSLTLIFQENVIFWIIKIYLR